MAMGGISGESFDIAQGPAETGIIDVLLSVGHGALTEDAPLVLVSTGALGGARNLDLKGAESESAAKGSMALKGRMFYLSVQNSDIATNNITVKTTTAGGTINGAASFVVSSAGDYLLHHVAAGVWRINVLPRPTEAHASIARVTFAAADWDAGATKNSITILQTGAPAAGQVGPHALTVSGSYVVEVINTDLTPDEKVDVEVQYDSVTGNVTLKKAPKAADFAGVAVIIGSL
jgi:hypothetical protein